MQRRAMLKGCAAAVAVPIFGTACSRKAEGNPMDALVFDPDRFTVETKTVATVECDKKVTYRLYRGIVYVAEPVDEAYQSLNISVPVEVDGKPVDTSKAPILFSNSVGGYLSSSATSSKPNGFDGGDRTRNPDLALVAGYVVVESGARGRDLVADDGVHYGVAPAAIVDLKAAVRYLRHNSGRVPGNTDRIVTTGVSAGGALSALLGASGDSRIYDRYLDELGAADASDAVFASACYCPIADLEHADMAYEWNWGANPLASGELDPTVSRELSRAFVDYQASLGLQGKNGFGPITADNYGRYLVRTYLEPAATEYLTDLTAPERSSYLADNTWITWAGDRAEFPWQDFLVHVGQRTKNAPAFDAFDLSSGENNLFGVGTTKARHFTHYSLRTATGDAGAQLDRDLPEKITMMNPTHFIGQRNPARAKHWWIRVGTKDTDTSLTVVGNLAAGLENLGDAVDAAMYWDAGHGSNEDPEDFIEWIGKVTGYR
ncbi:Tat pathway signal sequence domain protein [Nocardia sp. NBC_00508]|uniref:subtype B tannase n=1 Tax=Nocardia sp. NBC_00508 TaxID=2975992 RepID=UPI002E81519A|nr:subtype B tannase [Nocardia sp. NBC_00508]WUD68460.1 Tat pathway signal sequence domain protein [Nocardia sp. NBC_00508]